MKYQIIFSTYDAVINAYLFLLSFLKIRKNRIIFHQPFKYGYDCNPRYVAEEFIKRNKGYELIWVTRPHMAEGCDYPPQIKVVSAKSIFKLLYYFSTAKCCYSNCNLPAEFRGYKFKRKGQVFINNWHGSLGIKKIGASKQNIGLQDDFNKDFDIFVSDSEFETDVYKNSLCFKGEIVKLGHPRNDVFFEKSVYYPDKNKIKRDIENFLGKEIGDKKIILYAPTFREFVDTECFNMDYKLLLECMEKRFNQEFILALKFHPRTNTKYGKIEDETDKIYNFTHYNDMQGLMVYSDIIITDYSSCIFDFMLSKKPGFIYASDIDYYNNKRGFYYSLESTPFPVIRNNQELEEKILSFDENKYKTDVDKFLEEKGCLEDGNSSIRVADFIENVIK